jgi:flavin-dependent dehydrogenase
MASDAFDCVIVGARCSGAPLATHLARAGMRVCLLDAARLPSDQPFSTHAILPLGMELLDELGVGPSIRKAAPPVRRGRLSAGRAYVDLRFDPERAMYCPRRELLDPLLLEAAVSAGAQLHDETAVLELLREEGRVVGVRTRHRGTHSEVRARFVVGADGRNSTVAKLARAEEYLACDAQRGGYWAYWPLTRDFASLPFQTFIDIQGDEARFAFRTDGDLVIAGALDRCATVRGWAKDTERHVKTSLARSEVTRSLVADAKPASRFVGLIKMRFFFRRAVGPGWALVGDAGLHKDPTPGYGITDALRDAKALARALSDGREAALDVYWRQRDVQSLPLFVNANAMGSLGYANPFNEVVLSGIEATRTLDERVRATIDRQFSPLEMVPTWRVFAWTAAALLKGRFDIWPHFVEGGRRGTWAREELGRRQALLDQARQKLAASGRRS